MAGIEVALGTVKEKKPGPKASGVKRLVRPDVHDLVAEGLNSNGYDGLYYDGECSCQISNLATCGEFNSSCTAGYKVVAPKGVDSDYDFWICASKDDKPWDV